VYNPELEFRMPDKLIYKFLPFIPLLVSQLQRCTLGEKLEIL